MLSTFIRPQLRQEKGALVAGCFTEDERIGRCCRWIQRSGSVIGARGDRGTRDAGAAVDRSSRRKCAAGDRRLRDPADARIAGDSGVLDPADVVDRSAREKGKGRVMRADASADRNCSAET